MIQIKDLTCADVGRDVMYRDPFGEQRGKIKSWNSQFVFVVYKYNDDWENFKDYTGVATHAESLTFL